MRLAALTWICVAAAAAGPQWETNFAEGPSVEHDRDRDDLPDGWHASAFRSPAKLAWDKTVAHSGTCSLRISDSRNPAANEWNEMTGRCLSTWKKPVTGGATYALAAWIKTEGVTGRANARIAWWSDNRWLAESTTESVTGTGDWRRVSITVDAPPKANAAMIYLGLSDSEGTAWFDDVSMAPGTELASRFETIDLRAAASAGLAEQLGEEPEGLPRGEAILRGVPFRLIAPQENDGKTCVVPRVGPAGDTPPSVEIPVKTRCDSIYFLHCATAARSRKRVGEYELLYEDGSTAAVPLTCGQQIAPWREPTETDESAVGWEAPGEAGPVGLGVFPLRNPKPDAPLRAIRLRSSGGEAAPILVAITTADGPPLLSERPILYEFNDTSDWYPFNFPLDDTNRDTIDLTGLLDPPAGKRGFVEVRDDGHFYFRDGTRARFFGTNVGGRGAFPEKGEAEVLAARLASTA